MRIYQHIFIIRTNKPADLRLIITALQIVHPRLFIIVVPLKSVRVVLSKCPCHAACDAGQYTPAVISVVYYSCTIGVNQSCDRHQAVTDIILIRTLISDGHQLAAAVIQVMLPYTVLLLRQDTAARCQVFCCDAVHFLGCPDAGCIIRICVYSLFFLLFLLFCHI